MVIVRSFTKDGYQKDIAMLDEKQVRMSDVRIDKSPRSFDGIAVRINPEEFAEAAFFEVVVRKTD